MKTRNYLLSSLLLVALLSGCAGSRSDESDQIHEADIIVYGGTSAAVTAAIQAKMLVPVCVSSSHIAYGSIRMEPVFMILGQSAATAASIAIDRDISVQEVDYTELRERLEADDQRLVYKE